ncbi:helix-turn-helix transcriptional regulator [Gracilibacillus timonensis]|uniref:helix-turn-helix transcriptional regulator n=1 Tax=Gracilibacillus timonensis TaxID=1816696 RepID=UPI000826F58B|nr:helix-turn-helix transcriptional regulator [Gracilibacillus timonensis]
MTSISASTLTAEEVRLIRQFLELTQEEFAKAAGMTRATIANIEADRVIITGRSCHRIVKLLEPVKSDFINYMDMRRKVAKSLAGA